MEDRPSHRPRGAEVAVNMDLDAAKFWFQVAQTLITAALGVYVYISNRNRVTNERISSLERDMDTRIDGHTERLAPPSASPGWKAGLPPCPRMTTWRNWPTRSTAWPKTPAA